MKGKQLTIIIVFVLLLLFGSLVFAEESTVIDNESVAIRINGFEENLISFGMKLSVENKTNDTLIFSLKDVTVNGTDNPPLWAVEVEPGAIKQTSVNWYALGDYWTLGDILDISGTFRVYLKEDWNKPDIATAEFSYYPKGADHVVVADTEGASNGKMTVVDDERFRIAVNGSDNSSFLYCYGLSVSLENRTALDLMYTVRDVSINGIPCDPFWAAELKPGTEKTDTIGWFADSFEECGIETVEKIEAVFVIYEAGQWNPDMIFEQTATIEFK